MISMLLKNGVLVMDGKAVYFYAERGDTGNYEPNNLRIDTPQSNTEEALSMYWKVRNPQGETFEVFNLTKFCRENSLDLANMHRVMRGKQKQYKGWESWK